MLVRAVLPCTICNAERVSEDNGGAIAVAIEWCRSFAGWDRANYLRRMGLPLALAEFFELQPPRRPADFAAEVSPYGDVELLQDNLAVATVRLDYVALGKQWTVDRVQLRREDGKWWVVDYREGGIWRSSQTCMHVSAPHQLEEVWLCPVMVRQAHLGDFWTFVAHNGGDHARRFVLRRQGLQGLEMHLDPGESQVFWAGFESGHTEPQSWQVQQDRRWARPRTARFELPQPAEGHPRQGWCRGYSHWQFALTRLADRVHPVSFLLPSSVSPPEQSVPWQALRRSAPRAPRLL